MKLIMAVSSDGYLCDGPEDDMSWTGPLDKALFRALTSVGGLCAVGQATYGLMPPLVGRQLIPLSSMGYQLGRLHTEHPDAWLLGGPTLGRLALLAGFVTEFHLNTIHDTELGHGMHLCNMLGTARRTDWKPAIQTTFGNALTHKVFRL